MNALVKLIGFGILSALAWHIGGVIPAHTWTLFMGFLFGSFVGIPAMLLMAQNAQGPRADVYHHPATEPQQQPQKQPAAAIPARPENYVVIDEPARLQAAQQPRIEVSR